MSKSKSFFLTLAVFMLLSGLSIFAQGEFGTVGKLYTKAEADQLYGPVLESIEIDTDELISIINKAEDYAMFTIKNHQIIITDKYRELISPYKMFYASVDRELFVPSRNIIDDNETLYLYSISMIKKAVESGAQSITKVERRAEKLTITIGSVTLQRSMPCPPFCHK